MKIRIVTLLALWVLLVASPALALDLQTARTSGLVGEKADGYIVALTSSVEAKSLAADINARRKKEYERISKENGQPVDIVAKLAFQQIIAKLPAGSSYQTPDGSWKKR